MATPHEHVHTLLKVPRTNAGALTGAAVAGAIVTAAGALLAALQTGVLKPPPGSEPYLPWFVAALIVVTTIGASLGLPSLHPGLPASEPHYGPLVPPRDGGS